MDVTPAARKSLSDQMEDRRLELGLTWREVADAAGLSYEVIRTLRSGPGGIRPLTMRKLDRALGWPPGHLERILTGEEPLPPGLPPVVAANWDNVYVRRIWNSNRLPRDAKEALIEDIAEQQEDNGGSNHGTAAVS